MTAEINGQVPDEVLSEVTEDGSPAAAQGVGVDPEEPITVGSDAQSAAAEHAATVVEAAAEGGTEPLIKVMIDPTTCAVSRFESGQRLITMTQQGVEISIPLGPDEAQQLSERLAVPKGDRDRA